MVEDNKNNDTKEELKTPSNDNDMDTKKVNENENLIKAAKRELYEETSYKATKLKKTDFT